MSKAQKKVIKLLKALGEATLLNFQCRGIPETAVSALIWKGKVAHDSARGVYFLVEEQ